MSALSGRRIVLTGASRGLGRALALAFWAAGADLRLVARPSAELDALVAELRASGRAGQVAAPVALDLTEPDASARVFAEGWDAVDGLVNNAAIQGPIGPLWETPLDEWRRAIEVDLLAPVALCQRAVPLMAARGGGCIVNLGGGGAASGRPGFSAYAAAKSGLVRLTECLAAEAAPLGVAVTAVAPGAMPTAMLEAILEAGEARAGAAEIAAARRGRGAGSEAMVPVIALCLYLAEQPRPALSGRLIAARWDDWRGLEARGAELAGSDVYMLRRIRPGDRGKDWDEAS